LGEKGQGGRGGGGGGGAAVGDIEENLKKPTSKVKARVTT